MRAGAGAWASSGYLMVRGLFMPLGRVILAASEARVRGQASRNSSAINIAICLIEDQIQSNGPTHLFSGQSLTGAGRRSELSLLLSCEAHSFLKKVWARIWKYISGAVDSVNLGLWARVLWARLLGRP